MNEKNTKQQKIELNIKVCEKALKNVFDQLIALKKRKHAEHISFGAIEPTLDGMFEALTGPLQIEWEHGNFTPEERVEFGKKLGHCQEFYHSQKNQLLRQINGATTDDDTKMSV